MERIISNPRELESLAKDVIAFAGNLKLWCFYGEMGAGKTTFVRSICDQLGVKENVSSPTFALINEYRDGDGKPIYHFDFFRIEKESETVNIGCEEYFESGHLCLIEWPEKILNLLPDLLVKVRITLIGKMHRFIFSYE